MRNKKKLCLLLTVMLLGLSAVAEDAVTPVDESAQAQVEDKEIKANKETFEKAQEAMANKDYQSAIVYLSVYIASKPKKYEAYKLRGECFYELRQYSLAQKDFETAVKLKTDDDKFVTGAKVLSAVVLGADKQEQYQNPELGNLYASLMYAQKAQNNPAYEVSYENAGKYNSHIYLPKPEKNDIAKINCPQKYGKKINQTGVNKYIYDAIDDIAKQDYNEAIYKTQYITSNYPKYFLGHYLSGVALVGLEQEKEAISAFETSIKLNPYDFESYASLGQIYYVDAEKSFSQDAVNKSVDYFKKALIYNPDCYLYHYYIGLNYLSLNDYDNAVKSFNSAIKNKQNDYNSRYYKSIAQFMSGDYQAVVEETSKLLYRHVSNYNSVLYLRALANYKLGLTNAAVADIEKIQNNMNDIYNDDVKVVSEKEKTLPEYLYYLKAKISKDGGFGAIADFNNAFKNPLIKALNENSQSITLSQDEIEHQFDYIRTTFDNLDLNISYSDEKYNLSVKKSQDRVVKTVEPSKEELLLDENQTSIAKMLASNEFASMKAKNEESEVPVVVEDKETVSAVVNTEDEKPVENFKISYEKEEEPISTLKDEDKAAEDFTISYPKEPEPVQTVVENNIVNQNEQPTAEPISQVTEKHADVDLSKFNIVKNEPEINPTDEVIEFTPEESFIFKADKVVEQAPFNITIPEEPQSIAESENNESVVEDNKIEELVAQVQESVEEPALEVQNVEIRTVEEGSTPDEDVLSAQNRGEVETTASNPMLQRIMIPTMLVSDTLKKETENVTAVKTSDWVDEDKAIKSVVQIEEKVDEVEQVTESQLDEVKAVIEDALDSAQETIEVPQETKVKVKKSKKKKVKIKKEEEPKEKTEAEVAVEAIVQSVFTGETEDVVNLPEQKEEKPVKVKKQRVKKEKVRKVKAIEENTSPVASEVEQTVDLTTPAVTIINPERKPKEHKIRKFFQRAKKEKTESAEVEVNTVKAKPKFSLKNLFKRKTKTPVDIPDRHEKKVIKEIAK